MNDAKSLIKETPFKSLEKVLIVGLFSICLVLSFVLLYNSNKYDNDCDLDSAPPQQAEENDCLDAKEVDPIEDEYDLDITYLDITFKLPKGSGFKDTATVRTGRGNSNYPESYRRVAGEEILINRGFYTFDKPLEISYSYNDIKSNARFSDMLSHYNIEEAKFFYQESSDINDGTREYIELDTSLDTEAKLITTSHDKPGNYYVLAPLKCPNDVGEPYNELLFPFSDRIGRSEEGNAADFGEEIQIVFDVEEDHQYYSINTQPGKKYQIETNEISEGVIPLIILLNESYDQLASNRFNIEIDTEEVAFIDIFAPKDSAVGCDATFNLVVTEI